MTEERFLDSLGEQAEREMAEISAAAGAEVRRIREEAQREARRRSSERIGFARREAQRVRSRIVNTARLEGRKTVLTALHKVVDGTVEKLIEASRRLRDRDDYGTIFQCLLDECLLNDGDRLICSRADSGLARSLIARRGPVLEVEVHDEGGTGLIVISSDGTFIQRNTFKERIRRARNAITERVAARILPGEERL